MAEENGARPEKGCPIYAIAKDYSMINIIQRVLARRRKVFWVENIFSVKLKSFTQTRPGNTAIIRPVPHLLMCNTKRISIIFLSLKKKKFMLQNLYFLLSEVSFKHLSDIKVYLNYILLLEQYSLTTS